MECECGADIIKGNRKWCPECAYEKRLQATKVPSLRRQLAKAKADLLAARNENEVLKAHVGLWKEGLRKVGVKDIVVADVPTLMDDIDALCEMLAEPPIPSEEGKSDVL